MFGALGRAGRGLLGAEGGFFILGEMVNARDEKKVSESEGFVLQKERIRLDMYKQSVNEGKRTSSTAVLISSASMRYIGGITWTGMLIRRSQNTKPTWH